MGIDTKSREDNEQIDRWLAERMNLIFTLREIAKDDGKTAKMRAGIARAALADIVP